MENKNTLTVKNFAQIKEGSVEFGDLTILVGPQASGKSLFLQLLKLIIDRKRMASDLLIYGYKIWKNKNTFLDSVFGEGMSSIWNDSTKVRFRGRNYTLNTLGYKKYPMALPFSLNSLYYIPAQRVLSMNRGWPKPFDSFDDFDPYVLKIFSETLRITAEETSLKDERIYFKLLESSIFFGGLVGLDTESSRKRFLLHVENSKLPFMSWSAGQKEFMPLLLSLYYLRRKRNLIANDVEWVVIEEPEMGLHPKAIQALMVIFLDLTRQGYKVIISTHSPVLLELAWAMNYIQKYKGTEKDLFDLFSLEMDSDLRKIFKTTLVKTFKTYYFDRQKDGVHIKDISELDAGSDDPSIANWGGLSEFASRAGDVVSRLVAHG